MPFTVIIPARYASSRLPGKPLLDIAGKPMIQWVVEAAKRSGADKVCVATDHQEIFNVVTGLGVACIMTAGGHESGTDRLQEAAAKLSLKDDDIVVNVQGDEPLIPERVIDQVAENLANNSWAAISTLCEPIRTLAEYTDRNAVKVVFDKFNRALYFSRASIPAMRNTSELEAPSLPTDLEAYRHIGLYAYRVSFLNNFIQWPMSALEDSEKLEQLRALSNGAAIHVEPSQLDIPAGVDTEANLATVRAALAGPAA